MIAKTRLLAFDFVAGGQNAERQWRLRISFTCSGEAGVPCSRGAERRKAMETSHMNGRLLPSNRVAGGQNAERQWRPGVPFTKYLLSDACSRGAERRKAMETQCPFKRGHQEWRS